MYQKKFKTFFIRNKLEVIHVLIRSKDPGVDYVESVSQHGIVYTVYFVYK